MQPAPSLEETSTLIQSDEKQDNMTHSFAHAEVTMAVNKQHGQTINLQDIEKVKLL